MSLESYLLFILTSFLLCISPGPDMMLLLARTLAQGRRAGVVAALGVNLGNYLHLLALLLGLSALLAASPWGLTLIRWLGAAYLLYLGISTLRSCHVAPSQRLAVPLCSPWQIFWQGLWNDVLNPKVAIFYLAFLPQFATPGDGHLMQMLVLGVTLNLIGLLVALSIVYGAARFTEQLRGKPGLSLWLNRLLGLLFIALGMRLWLEAL